MDLGQTKVAYTLIDIREIDAEKLMAGGHPADLPLAMLARGGANRLTEILKRANGLPDEERRKVLFEIAELSGLRRLQEPLIMELKRMSTLEIFLRVPLIRDAARDARLRTLRDQLRTKFRPLPKWADEKLESATSVQLQRWLKKVLTAETLEGVLGKK